MRLIKHGSRHALLIKTDHGEREVEIPEADSATAAEIVRLSRAGDLEMVAKAVRLQHQVISQIVTGKNMTMRDAIPMWLDDMRDMHKAPRTIRAYSDMAYQWVRDANLSNELPCSITVKHINPWVNSGGVKRSTRIARLTAIRSLFHWLFHKGLTVGDPSQLSSIDMNSMTHEQKEVEQTEPFTKLEVVQLLDNATNWFWKAAIFIGWKTGLRLTDICQLEWSCFGKGVMTVWTDKRDKRVELPLTLEIACALQIASDHSGNSRHLFPNHRDLVLSEKRGNLSSQFRTVCQRAGIKGKSFHSLRSTYINDCLESGQPMPHIARSVGHSSTRTTYGYLSDNNKRKATQ
jgi:integrase